jgi:predicted ATPase/DNA-binding SARP family transcriptional activator
VSLIELRLLGPPLVRWGKEILSPGPKAAGLLALLAVEGSATRERILGHLWPESTQKKAQGSLRYLLHSLRKSASPLIESDSNSLSLSAKTQVDIAQLSSATTPSERSAAAEMCRGDFCEGVHGTSPEFDDWLEKQRAHWGQTVVENLLELANLLHPKEGLKPARQAVLLDPSNETAHATVIRLLMRQGDVAEAHRQMERCREDLWNELGVEPSSSTLLILQGGVEQFAHNLPARSGELIGRVKVRRKVLGELERGRLVTMTGEGGIGKTTLAIDVGRELQPSHGVRLVELSRLSDPAEVEREVADACCVPEGSDLLSYLRSREMVLILDNCEHVVERCAELVNEMLKICPHVKVLATSREPLRIRFEQVIALDPLEIPALGQSGADEYPAVQLFLSRARQANAGFEVGSGLDEVIKLCRRLDGLPLAIELAAARTRSLSLRQILKGLDQRFRMLKNPDGTAESRQKTLCTLIEWSYDRLPEDDMRSFRALAVFRSGFHLEAASAILGLDEWDTQDLLGRLVEKSLLRTRAHGQGLRYYLLESLREFAWLKLEREKELPDLQRSHLDHFIRLAHSLCPLTKGERQRIWLDQLDSELANFRAALSFGLENEPAKALELGAALCPLWKDRDHREEGRVFLQRCLSLTQREDPEWPRALLLRGELEIQQAQCGEALRTLETSLELGREREDQSLIARATKGLGSASFFLKDFAVSRDWFQESLQGYQALQDDYEVANCINNLGMVELYLKNLDRAQELFEESRELHLAKKNHKGQGVAVGNLGYVAAARGECQNSYRLFSEALTLLQQVGALWNSAYFLEGLGRALAGLKRPEEAVAALAVAEKLRVKLSTPRLPVEQESYQQLQQDLEEMLGENFKDLWSQGQELEPNDFLAGCFEKTSGQRKIATVERS